VEVEFAPAVRVTALLAKHFTPAAMNFAR
jgi:hypothetical protein